MNALIEEVLPDGSLVLRSTRLTEAGFPHAFSTAVGPGDEPFDLSRPGQSPLDTPPDRLVTNLRRFTTSVDPIARLATPRQVHGTAIAIARTAEASEADLVVGDDPEWLVGIRTADCVPVLMGCRRRGEAVAIHAGWRGLVADALGVAVRHLLDAGSDPDDIVAAIGPAIGLDAFEVGPEVAAAFRDAGLQDAVMDRTPRPHVDLHRAATRSLVAAGIDPTAIDGLPICTVADRRFFSHRRDHGRTGRQLSAIRGWRPPG